MTKRKMCNHDKIIWINNKYICGNCRTVLSYDFLIPQLNLVGLKKAKENKIRPKTIIGSNNITKDWLVEWEDGTRSWEKYDKVKELNIFKLFIEENLSIFSVSQNERVPDIVMSCPSYIS